MQLISPRTAFALTLFAGSAALATFACVGDDPALVGGGDGGPGGDGSLFDGASPTAGELTVEMTPAQPEVLPGGSVKVHLKIAGSTPRTGNVKVSLAPAATAAGASPLTVDKAQLDLPGELPEGDVVVDVGASSRHGLFPITIVVTATAQSGAQLRTETSLVMRVVGSAGALDTGLGEGKGYFDFCPFPTTVACQPGDVFVYPDNRVLVVGSAYEDKVGDRFVAARFMPDGTLDPSFGTAGVVSQRIGTLFSFGRAEIAPMKDGSFVLAFTAASYLAYAHMSANGAIDPSWGQDGGVDSPLISGDSTNGRIVPTESGFLLVGSFMMPPDNHQVGAVRAHFADGGIDPSFGDGGTTTFKVSTSTTLASAVVDPNANGRIVVGGEDHNGDQTGTKAFLVALTAKGAIDSTFMGGPAGCGVNLIQGCATNDTPNTTQDGVKGILRHKNGYISVAGYSGFSPVEPTMKVFHTSSQGYSDLFNTIEVDAGADTNGWPGAFLVQPDDAFLVANGYYAQSFSIVRFDADGKLDAKFGANGAAQPVPGYVRRMGIIESGRQLFVIGSEGGSTPRAIRIARYWLR
ncbi:MAG TPA: delta-60 repeat domain-containing protein [Labilithrix sp.]|nr:delta-60 repeat domain-containing protein [Labilithrix sp.]